ncbi:hypothetical protein LIER_35984 [Lithospermum erythrorhizon]|uniref:Uncharacterized protein n=1 Tax=Lithospermum erythrorhizon TaxID=34254 RepID=A0AAV3NZE5_LITER
MVRTRGGVNTSSKVTKGKKKKEETSNDTSRVVEPQDVQEKEQNVKGQKKAKTKIEDNIGEAVSPIIEVRVGDSSHVEDVKVVGSDLNVSCVDDSMSNTTERPSVEALVETTTPSVRDKTMENVKGMESVYIPSVAGTKDVTIEFVEDDVISRKKKSKKRKNKFGADAGETSEPKRKLSKKERAAKRAKRAERKPRKAVEEEVVNDDVQKMGEEQTVEEQVSSNVRPTGFDSWNPTDEQQENNNKET